MMLHRLLGRRLVVALVCLFGAGPAAVFANNHTFGTSQLGGWAYIDRNNDGILAWATDPNPEFGIPGVEIRLYSQGTSSETLVATTVTDQWGRYFFDLLQPGTYTIRQTQPVKYLPGQNTLGSFQPLTFQAEIALQANPSVGSVVNGAFTNINLLPNVRGDFYNFAQLGMAAAYVSKRDLLASSPTMPKIDRPPTPEMVPEPGTIAMAWVLLLGASLLASRLPRSASRH